MKRALMILLSIGVVSFAAQAEATLITYDFNSLASGTYTEAAFNTNFLGVAFDNTGGSNFEIQTVSLDPDFSGQAVLNAPYSTSGNSTIATLSSLTDYVSVTIGDYDADADNLYLYAYDSANALLDSAFFYNPASSYAGNTLIVSTGSASIAWVEFYGVGVNNNSVYWDNFTFNDTSSVPEPSTMLLLGSGLVGFGLVRRKFKG
ncbi:MAG: PEP-CTERM sorting domain-containing protein [Deltaproteobacteria bacterium]|nr:PEP-CTERM sorting domain-containing protein [Deltaproteobacteria bacterium]